MTEPTAPEPPTPAREPSSGRRRLNALIWLAVGAFVVWMQWPMLKGSYYRYTGAAVPVSIEWRTDLDAASSDRYEISAIPAILILDGTGAVRARAGYLPASGMKRLLTEQRR